MVISFEILTGSLNEPINAYPIWIKLLNMMLILLEYEIYEEMNDSYWNWWDRICQIQDLEKHFLGMQGNAPKEAGVNLHYLLFDSEKSFANLKEKYPNTLDLMNLNNFNFLRMLKVRVCSINQEFSKGLDFQN